jgi:5,10-methylenetetrahydrofolate reductase
MGKTLVPLIFMSDGTHLSKSAGHKMEWPVNMTIGNRSSMVRQMSSMHCIVMVAHLPIRNKNRNIPQKWLDEQWQTNQEVLNAELRRFLQLRGFHL